MVQEGEGVWNQGPGGGWNSLRQERSMRERGYGTRVQEVDQGQEQSRTGMVQEGEGVWNQGPGGGSGTGIVSDRRERGYDDDDV